MAKEKLMPSFRGFESVPRCAVYGEEIKVDVFPKDGLLTAIFAPDPDTGMPRSDIHIQLSGSLDPSTQEYVRRVLARPIPSLSAGHSDPDVVLDSSRNYGERVDAYIDRLAGMVKEVRNYRNSEE